MLTTLRVFNTRVASGRKSAQVDASANPKPAHATVNFMSYSKNSSEGRMINMAQAWTRKVTESQLKHSLRYHPLPGLHARSLSTSRT